MTTNVNWSSHWLRRRLIMCMLVWITYHAVWLKQIIIFQKFWDINFFVAIKMQLKWQSAVSLLVICFPLLIEDSTAFNFPSLQSFTNVFEKLGQLMSNSPKSTEKTEPTKPKRLKRQSTDIGDESSNPFEIRSTRFEY